MLRNRSATGRARSATVLGPGLYECTYVHTYISRVGAEMTGLQSGHHLGQQDQTVMEARRRHGLGDYTSYKRALRQSSRRLSGKGGDLICHRTPCVCTLRYVHNYFVRAACMYVCTRRVGARRYCARWRGSRSSAPCTARHGHGPPTPSTAPTNGRNLGICSCCDTRGALSASGTLGMPALCRYGDVYQVRIDGHHFLPCPSATTLHELLLCALHPGWVCICIRIYVLRIHVRTYVLCM